MELDERTKRALFRFGVIAPLVSSNTTRDERRRIRRRILDEKHRDEDGNERQVKAVRYLQINKTITSAQYQQLFEASKATASRDLTDLTTKQLVSRVGTTGKGTSYVLIERKGLTKGSN